MNYFGILTAIAHGIRSLFRKLRQLLKFIYYCFIRPISSGGGDQQTRLDQFYQGQADVYDSTRGGLLRGRDTMLILSASHLCLLRVTAPNKPLVWIDIGGGTGRNIEVMDAYFPISKFDAIYIIDLCEPLLQVARERVAKWGWTNVTVLCQDAAEFFLPEWEDGRDPKGSIGFVTMSYSLTMIPRFYTVLDRIDYVLSPDDGLFGVADFYTAGKQEYLHEKTIGGIGKECNWFTRWFWQIFFEFDNVFLSAAQRTYLEYRFGTIKILNGRNQFVIPYVVQIPYFVWLGRSRFHDNLWSSRGLEVECDWIHPIAETTVESEEIEIEELPLTPFHYHIAKAWRLPYLDGPLHDKFRTFVHAFTWEDSMADMRHLQLSHNDSILMITHAGDSALHYAIASRPKRIHCVDMNPCQNHLLELKLATIQSLEFDDFFAMFGNGQHSHFPSLLDSKISPYLSSAAYQFWKRHNSVFASSFYLTGCSGRAMSLMRVMFRLAGVSDHMVALCTSDTLSDQQTIWRKKLRPVLLNPAVNLLLQKSFFWNAFGIPLNQRKMLLKDGGLSKYVRDTLDPLISTYLLKTSNYFYLLALLGHYTDRSCPEYLTPAGFHHLKANNGEAMDPFRLHTTSVIDALRSLSPSTLTHILLMDHLDRLPETSSDVDDEIAEVYRVLDHGGSVFWRSAARTPWYNKKFETGGFEIATLYVRSDSDVPMDRVNMHASFFKATKTICTFGT
ncbi:hypothetical protein B0H17DRAFT_1046760 [Mycena rosella]|uniref:Methyltransferase domain-containing protein n=1 Tax=Mycena rosella TaxID=1033263 RepID=A0AAD7DWU8_MYCRO|nr:hypothetical protein B0H17DRAFT_1046760 [Mycena rosella]